MQKINETESATNSTTPSSPLSLGWLEAPLGELAHLMRGVSYQKADAAAEPRAGYLPILRAANIGAEGLILDADLVYVPQKYVKAEQMFQPGDVLICMSSGSRSLVGKAAQLDREWPGSFGAFCAVARFKAGLEPKFAAYFFQSARYRQFVRARLSGVNINNLRFSDLEQLHLPVPPLVEQRRIVTAIESCLARLDAGIAALRRVQLKLGRYRALVFKAAAEGHLIPQDPTDEPADALLRQLHAARRVKGQKTVAQPEELPSLPEGWCWAALSAVADILAGYAFKSTAYSAAGFQIVKIGNVNQGRLNLAEKPTFVNQVEDKVKNRYFLKPGDLLITLTGTRRKRDYGFVALVENQEKLLLNQRVARLRFQPPLDPKFFLIALQSDHFQNRFFQYETGNVGQGNVRIAALTQEVVPVPPLAEQRRIVAEVERRLAAAERLEAVIEANLRRAERLHQAILEQAFTGQLARVKMPS